MLYPLSYGGSYLASLI